MRNHEEQTKAHRESLAVVPHHGLEFGDGNRPTTLVVESAERFQDLILRLWKEQSRVRGSLRTTALGERHAGSNSSRKRRCVYCCPGKAR
jgi:hypothetical protein